MRKEKQRKYELRKGVLFSGLAIFGATALVGILNNQALIEGSGALFSLILDDFGWLFQIVCMTCLIVTFLITFSKAGNL